MTLSLIDYELHFIGSCMTRREPTSNTFPDRFAVGLGWITAALGLVGSFDTFVSLPNVPDIVAWGFIVLGLALIASGLSRSKPAAAFAAVAVTLGVGTLAYYLTGWALPFSEIGWSRMAPTAGLCFLLIGVALLHLHFVRPPHRALVALLAGCSTAALAVVALFFTFWERMHGPAADRAAAMAFPTASAFLLVGAGVVLVGWRASTRGERSAFKLPVTAGLAVIVLTLVMGQVVRTHQRVQIQRTIAVATEGLREQLRLSMNAHVLAVSRFIELLSRAPERDGRWRREAQSLFSDFAGLKAVAYLSSAKELEFVFPDEKYGSLVLVWVDSAETADPFFGIDNLDLEGERGFVLFSRRRQELAFGYHVEVFVYDEMFDRILRNATPGHSLEIYSGNELVYRRAHENLPLVEERWKQQAELGQFGLSWSLAAWPTAATLQTSRSPLPVVTLLVGNVVAMLLAFAVQLAQTSRHRASAIERINHELENEMNGRKRAEEQLRQSQKMEAVGRLAGGIAHDFNNLLTVVYGYADLLSSTLKDELEQRYAREIVIASKRARDLTSQLLAFGRRQVLDIRIHDLCEVLQDTRDMVQRLIGEDIALVFERGAQPCRVKADHGQFQQVIINLAANAREAMPEGGTLALRTGADGSRRADCEHDGARSWTVL